MSDIPDPKEFGCALAERAIARMNDEGISRAELGAIYSHDLAALAKKIVRRGISKHAAADWLEAVTAAYCERFSDEV
jgi:putative heme iron utilization protein